MFLPYHFSTTQIIHNECHTLTLITTVVTIDTLHGIVMMMRGIATIARGGTVCEDGIGVMSIGTFNECKIMFL